MKRFPGHLYLLLLAFLSLVFSGCAENKPADSVQKKYSIYTMSKDGHEYLVTRDSLDSGMVNSKKDGAVVKPSRIFHDLIVCDGYYYRLDRRTGKFSRSTVKNNILTEDATVQIEGFTTCQTYNWMSRDSLLLIGYDDESRKVRSARINVKSMQAVQDVMEVQVPFGAYNSMSIGFSRFSEGKLIIGYSFHTIDDDYNYTTGDTIYVDVLSYPQMRSLKKLKDTRTTYPGDENTRQPHFFTDEKGDFYFIASPGIAGGNNPAKPTAIYRMKKSENTVDADYFFNISESEIQNHGYGLWYTGNGKAIIRTERKNIFTGMKDHWKVPHFDYYVIDLQTKSTARLNLPLDKGTAKQCVLVGDGVVYIAVNSESAGNFIWLYNPKTGSLKKGLKFDDQTDYILRIERLN
jgi:hypothetical protein